MKVGCDHITCFDWQSEHGSDSVIQSLGLKWPHKFPHTFLVLLPLTIIKKPRWMLVQGGGKTPKRGLKWSMPILGQLTYGPTTMEINDVVKNHWLGGWFVRQCYYDSQWLIQSVIWIPFCLNPWKASFLPLVTESDWQLGPGVGPIPSACSVLSLAGCCPLKPILLG